MRPTRRSLYSLCLFSGLLLIFCQPPVSLFFFAYVALVPLFFALRPGESRHNFLAGFATGIVCYTGLFYWVVVAMNEYGGISVPFALLTLFLLVLYVSLYTGCFAWLVLYLEKRLAIPLCLSAPPLWVLLEYLRGILLTGFPWSLLAHSQYNFLTLVQVASITGTYFLSFLIVAVNCLLYEILAKKRFPKAYGTTMAAVFAACLLFGLTQMKEPIPGTLSTAIVQGNVRQDIKFDEAYKNGVIEKYISLTSIHSQGADLVIWPETAMPFIFLEDRASAEVRAVPSALRTRLLVGTISRGSKGQFYNTAYLIGRQGEISGTYNKVHLVPFGEYTPLLSYFPFLGNISVAVGDFSSGPNHDPMVTSVGRIGLLICYEGIFPALTIDTVRRGAQVLVNITNDAWFGPTSAPYQHLAFYTFRAVETDRFVLRAANTGISAIIDPHGRILAKTGIFKEAVLKGVFSLRDGQTIYVRYGDYFVLLAFLFLAALVARGIRKGTSKGT